jgi:hypothetical protein
LNIFWRGFSLSSRPQHTLKVLLLLTPMCLLKYVLNCEQNSSFFIFRSGLTVTGLARVYCIMDQSCSSVSLEGWTWNFGRVWGSGLELLPRFDIPRPVLACHTITTSKINIFPACMPHSAHRNLQNQIDGPWSKQTEDSCEELSEAVWDTRSPRRWRWTVLSDAA